MSETNAWRYLWPPLYNQYGIGVLINYDLHFFISCAFVYLKKIYFNLLFHLFLCYNIIIREDFYGVFF